MGDSSHLRESLKHLFGLEKNKRLQEAIFHSKFSALVYPCTKKSPGNKAFKRKLEQKKKSDLKDIEDIQAKLLQTWYVVLRGTSEEKKKKSAALLYIFKKSSTVISTLLMGNTINYLYHTITTISTVPGLSGVKSSTAIWTTSAKSCSDIIQNQAAISSQTLLQVPK